MRATSVPGPLQIRRRDDGVTTGSMMNSFSGNAFSVKIGRGKFMLPCGQPVSSQKPRMYSTKPCTCSGVSVSPNAGICDESPTAGPPSAIASSQSASGSAVAVLHSVKSSGTTSTVGSVTFPLPSCAWHRAHHSFHISGIVTGMGWLVATRMAKTPAPITSRLCPSAR